MKGFFRNFSLALAVVAFAFIPAAARADTFVYTITAVGNGEFPGITGSGTIVATPDAGDPGEFDITSITGILTGVESGVTSITGLLDNPNSPNTNTEFNLQYDDLLDPTGSTVFDTNGVAFSTNVAGYYGNIYSEGDQLFYADSNSLSTANEQAIDFTLTETPEPSSLLLFGTGILGAAGLIRRRIMAT